MVQMVRITEQDLRAAMREPRYWQPNHAERQPFNDWVTQGWSGLNPADGPARTSVWVRAYVRDGHLVSAHWRSAPLRGHGGGAGGDSGSQDPNVVPANYGRLLSELGRRVARALSDGRGGGARPPSAPTVRPGSSPAVRTRRPGADGRDRVQEMRDESLGSHKGLDGGRIDQWMRPGGRERLDADLRNLGVRGQGEEIRPGVFRHTLPDGRQAIVRPSTSPGSDGLLTLEIGEPGRALGRINATDKFRYP